MADKEAPKKVEETENVNEQENAENTDNNIENENDNDAKEKEKQEEERKKNEQNDKIMKDPFYVNSSDLFSFLFPSDLLHSHSTLRLYLFAEHGPLHNQHSYGSCLCMKCKDLCKSLMKKNTLDDDDDEEDQNANDIIKQKCKQLFLGKILIGGSSQNNVKDFDWLCEKCKKHCVSGYLHLRSGSVKQPHIVTESELSKMQSEMQKQDIMQIFLSKKELLCDPLNEEQCNEVYWNQPVAIRNVPKLSKNEIVENMLSKLEKHEIPMEIIESNDEPNDNQSTNIQSYYKFHEIARIVNLTRKERLQKVFEMSYITNKKAPNGPKQRSKQWTKSKAEKTLMKLTNKYEKVDQCRESKILSQLLHHFTHQIATLTSKSKHDITQNVTLLRPLEPDAATNWDNTCCLSNKDGSFSAK